MKIAYFWAIIFAFIVLTACSIQSSDDDFISIKELSKEKIGHTLLLSGQYLLNNQADDGRLEYKYFPSQHRFSTDNNMIRQFMSTIALAEMKKYTNNDFYQEVFDRNLKFNIKNYYTEDNGYGIIFFDEKAKLGAAAFAIISILESNNPSYDDKLNNLIKTVDFLHNETDGSFRTFYLPKDRNDNQYFYPGETMLALMILFQRTGDEEYLNMVKQSFDYYSEYYEDKMNPSFIPWHTQALYRLYQSTGNRTYADYILSINDWLILIQDKGCMEPKHLGRFYNSGHTEYGPPHASSTAVYVEGLAYAYDLAEELGDGKRADSYREAILLGVRSLMELQFKDADAIGRNDAGIVLGGIRTSTDNDEIRVDNNQHTIMALSAVLDFIDEEDIDSFAREHKEYYCS